MTTKAGAACAPNQEQRIEWTGAGRDHFLGIVVDQADNVISECWGTREEIHAWMETSWPHLPTHYVPMVYTSVVTRRGKLRLRSKNQQADRASRMYAKGSMAASV